MSLDIRKNSDDDRLQHQSLGAPSQAETTDSLEAIARESEPIESFAETALRLGGKSVDESSRTGKIDTADDQVEQMFAPQYQTTASPIHRTIWSRQVPLELFRFESDPMVESIRQAMDQSVNLVQRRKRENRLLDRENKISQETLDELASTGYWGLLIPTEYGGLGSSFRDFTRLLTRMAAVDPTVAGLGSVHGCIGAVDPVRTFGNVQQKQKFLPSLADGRRLSGFALTEPCAGSDLTALRTTAELRGKHYWVTGEKLFITNVTTGRTLGLVCLIEDRPAVLIVDLPNQEDDSFQLKRYGLYALQHAHNRGIVFRDFAVPAENRLTLSAGDGLTIAYHGLNLGRVSLCANAAGTMRMMLTNLLPWAAYRKTYGQAIAQRELVRRRIGEMAGYIAACDALVDWCSNLIDRGFRGEMECIVAKIFGSEAQKTAAIELLMKTHGGRSFLKGHLLGDNIHDFLAPCIYEGEGEMLSMAFFKSLVKNHGKQYFEPIGRTLLEAKIKSPNLANPWHAWKLRSSLAAYAKWWVGMRLVRQASPRLDRMSSELRQYAADACDFLTHQCFEVSHAMRTHQLKFADRQCAMTQQSRRIQDCVVILVTSLYGARQPDPLTQQACEVICGQLWRGLQGQRASNRDFRNTTQLGGEIADGGWSELEGITSDEIMMQYTQQLS